MDQELYKNIVAKKPYLFWSVGDKHNLSERAVVEAVLTRGDFEDFRRLVASIGLERVAKYFNMISVQPRSDMDPRTKHFWKLYFDRHVSGRSQQ